MKNLWIKIAWIAAAILSFTGISTQIVDACQTIGKKNKLQFLLAQNLDLCQQLKPYYQEVHAFETQNFYINVCRHQQKYYYHRRAKQNPDHTVLLPANSISNGNMFQAFDRGKTYIVGTNAEGYYSSVLHKNNFIIFEPALKQQNLFDNRKDSENLNSNNNKQLKCSNYYIHSYVNYQQKFSSVFY